jgi:threonine dehydratase
VGHRPSRTPESSPLINIQSFKERGAAYCLILKLDNSSPGRGKGLICAT